jgi:transcription antitermination factor NusG
METEGTKWYSLRVISGKESKIKERIELEINVPAGEIYHSGIGAYRESV